MPFVRSEPSADWKKVKDTFDSLLRKLNEQTEQDKLAVIDYWIGELFRLRSYIEAPTRKN